MLLILIRGVASGMKTPVRRSRLGVSMLPSMGDLIVRLSMQLALNSSIVRADFNASCAEMACSLLCQLGLALSWRRCSLACSNSILAMAA